MREQGSFELRRIFILAFVGLLFIGLQPTIARAQSLSLLPPVVSARDDNDVDLIGGSYKAPVPTLSVGTKESGISRTNLGYSAIDNLTGLITADRDVCLGCLGFPAYAGIVNVSGWGQSDEYLLPWNNAAGVGQLVFADYSSPGTNPQYPGADSLTCTGAVCTYTLGDGTVETFTQTGYNYQMVGLQGDVGRLAQVQKPDGEVLTYTWNALQEQACTPSCQTVVNLMLSGVSSSLGWSVKYPTTAPGNPNQISNQYYMINTSIDYCDLSAVSCTAADQATWPIVIGSGGFYPNSSGGSIESFDILLSSYTTFPTAYVVGYSSPLGGTVSTTTFPANENPGLWNNDYKIKTLTRNGKTWTYQYSPFQSATSAISITTVTNPDGSTRSLTFECVNALGCTNPGAGTNLVLSATDELGHVTKYQYIPGTLLVSEVIEPEATYSGSTLTGGYTQYSYDARHNVTQIAKYPKGGGTPIITSAVYPTSCTNQVTCNKPTSVTDANGNTTTLTYDPTHGGVLSETKAAVNGVQAQIRYAYTQITPWVMNSSGVLTASPPVWRLTGTSVCKTMTLATCVGTADEIKTITSYGSDNTHPTYNNVLPVSVTTVAGDGSNSSTITSTYDNYGHVISQKGPRTDVDDTRYTTYDMYGRPIFQIGADPDGSGPLPRVATKTTYDAEGRVLEVDNGTTTTSNGSDFTVTSSKINTYDTTSGMLVESQEVQP